MERFRVRIVCIVIGLLLAMVTVTGCESDESDDGADERQVQTTEQDDDHIDGPEERDSEKGDQEADDSDDDKIGAESEEDEESEDDDEDSQDGEEEGSAEDDEEADEDVDWAEEFGHLPFYATGAVAIVDGERITAREFNQTAADQLGQIPADALQAEPEEILQFFIDAVIVAHLLEREVERKGVEVTDAEIDEAIREFRTMLELQMGGDTQAVDAMLAQQGITDAELRMQAEQDLLAEKLISQSRDISVSDQRARQFYNQNQAMFQQQESALVRHILVDDEDEAKTLAGRLKEGGSFESLARQHSTCRSAPHGGELGAITREQVVPEFADVAFSLSVGEISDPVESSLGWHIIQVHRRQEEGTVSFEEVKEDLKMMLAAQRLQEAALELIEELRDDAEIEILEDNVVIDG